MKQIIFNVGAGLSTYIETSNRKVLIDVGSSNTFNPVTDFLLPLFMRRKELKPQGKYSIDQLIITHPHKDHISGIEKFNEYFTTDFLTTPNDNTGMKENELINWSLVGNQDDSSIITLKNMLYGRRPPLTVVNTSDQFLYYLPPKEVEYDLELKNESYINNMSLVSVFRINGYSVLIPGDIQKKAMKKLIKEQSGFRRKLKDGIDVLIAPHHGLQSSFSSELFEIIKNNKTRCINIISEKPNTEDNRNVDTRYSSNEFCEGKNSLKQNQIKTSNGHILIDYSSSSLLNVEIIKDNNELIDRFMGIDKI